MGAVPEMASAAAARASCAGRALTEASASANLLEASDADKLEARSTEGRGDVLCLLLLLLMLLLLLLWRGEVRSGIDLCAAVCTASLRT